jgi:hypothetical protein
MGTYGVVGIIKRKREAALGLYLVRKKEKKKMCIIRLQRERDEERDVQLWCAL